MRDEKTYCIDIRDIKTRTLVVPYWNGWIDRKSPAKDRDTSSAIPRGQKSYYSYLGGSTKYEKEESSDLLVVGYENYIQIIAIQ